MIGISKIIWLSEDAKEAEVHLSDKNFNIVVFSQPFNQKIGDDVPLPLYALNTTEVYMLNNEVSFVERNKMTFEYKLSGCVINKEFNQVKVGEFIIELDIPLPNDININDYVSFVCDRIDLY